MFFKLFLFLAISLYGNGQCRPFKQFHEATYKLGWDIHFSPYAGGEDLLFVNRCIERTEGWIISKSPIWYSKETQARLWRLSELYLFWLPLNSIVTTAQHEIFGHGYRIRDINRGKIKVTGYDFNVPPPYGYGGAATAYKINPETFTTTEETCVAMGGVESTAILAELVKLKWLEAEKIDPRQTVLYLLCQHDLNLYIGTLKTQGDLDGHDIRAYIKSLNQTYTSNSISGARLRSLSWINLGDPFTFYSIYAWFHYISSGKESSYPMIPILGAGYLPNVRVGLTPFGPEFYFENWLVYRCAPYYFYLKGGHHSNNDYYGIGFYGPKIWNVNRWAFGLRFDAWRQPELLLFPADIPFSEIDFDAKPNKAEPLYPYSEQNSVRYGASGSFILSYQSDYLSGGELELGYKAQGFVPGEALTAQILARLYYTLYF